MSTSDPSNSDPVVNLGLKLTKSCKYVYENQGFSIKDLIFMLHGIMGQVLSWEAMGGQKGDDHRFDADLPPWLDDEDP
jgi:hypothetical protein